MKLYQKLDTKKLGLKQYCRYALPQTVKQSRLTDTDMCLSTRTPVFINTPVTLTHTLTAAHALTHRGTETRSKQWDKLRQNILRPMQAPPPPEAELRQQGCTAPTFGMLVRHMFTV